MSTNSGTGQPAGQENPMGQGSPAGQPVGQASQVGQGSSIGQGTPAGRPRLGNPPGSSSLGIVLALCAAVISGGAVWLNAQAVTKVKLFGDPGTYTTAKNLVAALVVIAVAAGAGSRWRPAAFSRPAGKVQWGALLVVSIIGGSVPFLLFFEGLAKLGKEGAPDAQAVHKASLLVLVAILGPALLRERLGALQGVGLLLVTVGYLSMGNDILGLAAPGVLLVIGAGALWAVESVLDRWLLSDVSVATVAVARLGAGVVWLLLIGLFTGDTAGLGSIGATGWAWAGLTGLVLAAYVGFWLAALSEAQAVDVTAMLAFAVPVTAVVNIVASGTPMNPWYVLVLVIGGVAVVAAGAWNRAPRLDPVWGRV